MHPRWIAQASCDSPDRPRRRERGAVATRRTSASRNLDPPGGRSPTRPQERLRPRFRQGRPPPAPGRRSGGRFMGGRVLWKGFRRESTLHQPEAGSFFRDSQCYILRKKCSTETVQYMYVRSRLSCSGTYELVGAATNVWVIRKVREEPWNTAGGPRVPIWMVSALSLGCAGGGH